MSTDTLTTCPCGGKFYRHKPLENGARYRCKDRHHCITVRDGQVSTLRGRPIKRDWRYAP